MIRVAILSKAFVRGAYQRKLEEIARCSDIELTLITPPSWREGRTHVPFEPVFTHGYQTLITPLRLNGHFHLHFYPRLGALLRELRPDIVHVDEEPYNLATWLALRTARRISARRLFFTWQNIDRPLPVPFSTLERWSYRLADGAIAGNRDAHDVLQKRGYRGPIWVIPQFGIDPELFQPTSRAGAGPFSIGFAGRLTRAKGVDLLIRACATLTGNWRLILIGDGEERPRLEQLARDLGIAGKVTFRGEVRSTDMPRELAALDVLVLPSRSTPRWREQFGRVLVEAMACGVAVIGSDSGEIPRVIGEGGLVFPEEDWRTLARHLDTLQRDAVLRRMLGARGRARVCAFYTHQRIAEQTVAVYRALWDAVPARS
ncbi:MAG TPA: glycosyltransferase family 4 protein [Chloroflexota bacterium]|nr:glycosyltransferase family 4 protein [Chloroflexota bacterium]